MDRVTNLKLSQSILYDNNRTLSRLSQLQEQLATGKRVNRLSDDPVISRESLRLRTQSFQTQQYMDNIDGALSTLNVQDGVLGDVEELFDQAKSTAVQGANGSETAASRAAMAAAIDNTLSRLVDLANTAHEGRYVFAGTAVDQRPFALDATRSGATYAGNGDAASARIGPDTEVPLDNDGQALFKGGKDAFAALVKLRDALKVNDPSAVTASIADVDAAHGAITDARGALGGRTQRLEMARNRLDSSKLQVDGLISKGEDADVATTIADMQLAQSALQAGMQAGARIIKPTLLDYL